MRGNVSFLLLLTDDLIKLDYKCWILLIFLPLFPPFSFLEKRERERERGKKSWRKEEKSHDWQ